VQRLEQQCADWQGCVGTPTSDRVKIVGELRPQIQGLETQIGQAEGASAVTARITVASPEVTPVQGDGINRPVAGATSGSYINLSV
jgi:hypothetical protein